MTKTLTWVSFSRLTLLARLVACCFFLSHSFFLQAQSTFTISGYIEDGASGEKLISAIVYDGKSKSGVVSNTYGFYSLTLPKGAAELSVSFVGYETYPLSISGVRDTIVDFKLVSKTELQAVEVSAKRNDRIENQVQMSKVTVPIEQIKRVPALLGEVDVLKALQFLPGVQAGGEAQTALIVRGGSPDQNLILLDGVPVYNASHLGGLFSVFNGDAIKNVSLTKGGFPARFGGRLSSVLEIDMKEGNMKEFHGEGSIGILTSRLMLEGPILKDKVSFMVAGRRTYFDVLLTPFAKNAFKEQNPGGKFDIDLYFYDLNAKVNWRINENHRLFLSAFNNEDVFGADFTVAERNLPNNSTRTQAGLRFGNITSSLRWNWIINQKLFMNTTASYTRFRFRTDIGYEEKRDTQVNNAFGRYFSGVKDWAGRVDFDYLPSPKHRIRFGVGSTYHVYAPGAFNVKVKIDDINNDTILGAKDTYSHEPYAYVEDEMNFGKLKINAGLHYGGFFVEKSFFGSLQPRFGINYSLPKEWAVKASFASMQQNVNLLTNEGIGLPTDLWVPSTPRIVPQKSWQAAVGVAKTFNDAYEFSVEGYYKNMTNVLGFKEGASFLGEQNNWEEKVTQGTGTTYGIETFLQKKEGKTTGWVSYTLAWNNRQFADLNGGLEFPFKYDRRHDFKIVFLHEFTKRIRLNATWQYGTGNAVTLYSNLYRIDEPIRQADQVFSRITELEITSVGERNMFRLPTYHRMDMSIDFIKKKKRHTRTWSIGCYNVYARANAFALLRGTKYDETTRTSTPVFRALSLIPVPLPSFSYQFKF